MLAAYDISKSQGGRPILSGVDAAVGPGGLTAIVGPSGGGKSTLLRALALTDPPDAGRIEVDGRAYSFPAPGEIAPPWPLVTVVFQQFFLWPHLTLRGNIELPLRCAGKPEAEIAETVAALARTFAMDGFLDRHPNQVSGGQQQRAALARALALRPRYLLLDEITSALDLEQSRALFGHLRALRGEGIGVVLVTHFLGFVREEADAVLFLDGGTVAEAGGRKILSAPKTERLGRFLDVAR